VDLVGDDSTVAVLVAVDIVEPSLEEGADEAGQAGTHISTTNKLGQGAYKARKAKAASVFLMAL
jgi:hypothetical protein